MADKKDFTECITWLKSTHPALFDKIYNNADFKESLKKTHPLMIPKIYPEDAEGA